MKVGCAAWLLWLAMVGFCVWTFGYRFKELWIEGCDQMSHEACREWLE